MSIEITKVYEYSVTFTATEKQLKAIAEVMRTGSVKFGAASDEYSKMFYLTQKIEEALYPSQKPETD